jgi:hypothetical protein
MTLKSEGRTDVRQLSPLRRTYVHVLSVYTNFIQIHVYQ